MSSITNNKAKKIQGTSSALLLVSVAAFVIGIAFYSFHALKDGNTNLENLQKAVSLHEQPRELPLFSMTNHLGTEFNNKGLKNIWSFIFFGFTNCPDVCPNTLSVLDQVRNLLDEDIDSQIVLISVDQKRDTPKKLKEYVTHFDNEIVGLTGNKTQLDLLTNSLGAVYSIQKSQTDTYQVDHSAHIFVIAPNGKLTALFSTPHVADVIVDDFKIISNAYNENQKS